MAESTPSIARKTSAASQGAGQNGVVCGTARITDAQCLSLAQQLVLLDEATELPPFGMCMSGLQQRLKQRLGIEIAESAIRACLSPYYDLAEWEDRYITKSLGVEVQEFGSADHPPRSPLKEFSLSSDGEYDGSDDDDDDDGFGGDTVPAGRGAKSLDCAVHLGGGGSGGGNDDGDGAGEKMQEEDEDEEEEEKEEEEDEDAATGAGATGGEEFGAGSVGGGRARSGGGAGGGAAAAPMPAKAADPAGSKESPHLDGPAIRRTSHSAPSSSTGEVFQGAEKQRSYGTSGSPRGAGGGGAVEVDEMEVQ